MLLVLITCAHTKRGGSGWEWKNQKRQLGIPARAHHLPTSSHVSNRAGHRWCTTLAHMLAMKSFARFTNLATSWPKLLQFTSVLSWSECDAMREHCSVTHSKESVWGCCRIQMISSSVPKNSKSEGFLLNCVKGGTTRIQLLWFRIVIFDSFSLKPSSDLPRC